MNGTSIRNLSFSYEGDTRLILKDIDLEVAEGEFVCLLGQSGCGKSTFLRLLAGLEKPTTGTIAVDGKAIAGAGLDRGVVFQDYGLFPWMTAGDNIMLALKQRFPRMDKAQRKEIALNALRAVGLEESVFGKLPKELSGKRYAQAATNALSAIGYDMSKVYTLEGGFTAWSEKFPELAVAPDAAAAPAETEAAKEVPEVSTVRWNWGTSANILVALAIEKGYFEEYGLNIEFVNANENASAMTLLATGQVDVVSNSGTASPLQNIAAGVDMTIFGGHMVQGCMPVIGKKGAEWNGIESIVGKKFACNPSYFAFTGALMDAGYDNPMEVVDWVSGMSYPDALAALQRGEVDYALMGTGQNYQVNNMDDIEILTYQGDVMPDYSCCRMECPTEFIQNNPITIKCILKALIRAQAYYEANKEECVDILAAAIGADHDYVAAYTSGPSCSGTPVQRFLPSTHFSCCKV